MKFRIFLDICYMREAPPPNSVKIKFIQNKKEVLPAKDVRSPFAERFSETSFLLPNGESAKLEFDPKKLDSSTLKILIDTPDGQHAEIEFDLQSLRQHTIPRIAARSFIMPPELRNRAHLGSRAAKLSRKGLAVRGDS